MADYQITCIVKPDRYDPHQRIQSVGLAGIAGTFTVDQVLIWMGQGHRFWTPR